jgi:hypothetical protein
LIKAVPEPGRAIDRGLERVPQQIVEPSVAGIEQVQDFHPRFGRRQVLDGIAHIPRGDVFPFAETGREDENFLQNPGRFYSPLPL